MDFPFDVLILHTITSLSSEEVYESIILAKDTSLMLVYLSPCPSLF